MLSSYGYDAIGYIYISKISCIKKCRYQWLSQQRYHTKSTTDVDNSCPQPSSYCCDKVERHGRCINEFPINENSFFDCVADQLSSHLVMLDDGTKVSQYVVRKVTCNYIKDHAEEL